MKLFECDNCGQVLFFENTSCVSCQRELGYCFESARLLVLPSTGQERAGQESAGQEPAPSGPESASAAGYRRCENYVKYDACNWVVPNDSGKVFCRSCELTEVIPDLSDPANLAAWAEIERAKRRLLYTLRVLRLPLFSRLEQPEEGLAFRFLRSTETERVTTGHSAGVITLDVAEANAAFRENQREKLGEGYRTLLGHLRHEIGHYYWDRIVLGDTARLQRFRELFGDERADYQEAIQRHYAAGPPDNWSSSFISAYATMHPWEDWAESWAHYLHMVDTLETAKCHGLAVSVPQKAGVRRVSTDGLALADFQQLAESWRVVTVALNGLSRSMGLKDAYPFVLSAPVQEKLRFIHELVRAQGLPRGRAPRKAAGAPKSQRSVS